MSEQTTKVVTGKVRFSYANVWKPKAINDGQEPKYSVCLLIPKSDTVTVNKIQSAIEAAIGAGKNKLADKNGKIIKGGLKLPLRDGDIERPDDDAYANCWFLNANSTQRPGIVDAARNEILDETEFYSGCYGRASVNLFAFNTNGNKGIGCGLQNLQKLADGPAFNGRSKAEDDFDEYEIFDDFLS